LWAYKIFQECVRSDSAADLYLALKRAHLSKDRFYHNWRHTLGVARCVSRHTAFFEHQREAVLAAFYHDCVYVPGWPDNEKRSADFAAEALDTVLNSESSQRVKRYILATATHDFTPDPSLLTLLDCDMAILAAPWEVYTRYALAIRAEFGRFSDSDYVAGRSKFLRETLGRREIFFQPPWQSREQVARENMERELRLLQRGDFVGKLW
jgi:predicted metal-dependent HD superfamily phosphohydrolase